MLSSCVINHLEEKYSSDPETAVAYFYFSFTDAKKQDATEMLASLVRQICARRPNMPQPVQDRVGHKDGGKRLDVDKLKTALEATIRGFSAVYLVVDGLDECPALSGERECLLDNLRWIIASAPDSVHIFCTSRKDADIDAALSPLLSPPTPPFQPTRESLDSDEVDMGFDDLFDDPPRKKKTHQANAKTSPPGSERIRRSIDLAGYRHLVDQDIGLYIDSTLYDSWKFNSWSANTKREARDSLIKKADGM